MSFHVAVPRPGCGSRALGSAGWRRGEEERGYPGQMMAVPGQTEEEHRLWDGGGAAGDSAGTGTRGSAAEVRASPAVTAFPSCLLIQPSGRPAVRLAHMDPDTSAEREAVSQFTTVARGRARRGASVTSIQSSLVEEALRRRGDAVSGFSPRVVLRGACAPRPGRCAGPDRVCVCSTDPTLGTSMSPQCPGVTGAVTASGLYRCSCERFLGFRLCLSRCRELDHELLS